MQIEAIELNGVGCFTQRALLGPLDPGLNILAQPNESGKSTLVRALTRALFDRYNGQADEIRALQPVGTALGPTVSVTFSCRGDTYRIEKRFLEKPSSVLSRRDAGSWKRLAESDQADARLRELLECDAPGRGASKPEHWGLFRYLWARQGEPSAWPEWTGGSGEIARMKLATIELDPVLNRVIERLQSQAAELLTFGQNRPKKNSELDRVSSALDQVENELVQLRERRRESDELDRRYRSTADEIRTLEQQAEGTTQISRQLQEQHAALQQWVPELERFRQDESRAREQLKKIQGDKAELETTHTEIARLEQESAGQETLLATARSSLESLNARTNKQREDLGALSARREPMQAAADRARLASQWSHAIQQAAALSKVAQQAAAAAQDLQALNSRYAALPAITPAKVKALQERASHVRELEIKLEAAGLQVTIEPATAAAVEWNADGRTDKVDLQPSQPATLTAISSASLKIPGFGTVAIQSGSTEASQLAAELNEARQAFRAELEKLQLASLEAAIQALQSRQEIGQQIKAAEKDILRLLGDHPSADRLQRELEAASAKVERLEQQLQPTVRERELPLQHFEEQEVLLNESSRSLHKAIEGLQRRLNDLREEREKAVKALTEHELNQQKVRLTLVARRARAEQLGGQYPNGIEAAIAGAQEGFVTAEARRVQAERRLPQDHATLPDRARRAKAAADQLSSQLENHRRLLLELEVRLKERGAEGLFSKEVQLSEKLEELKADKARLWNRARALRIAEILLTSRKAQATEAVLGPIETGISATLAELTGDPDRRVFLDEQLRILGVGRSRSEHVRFADLSQGTKEQLLLALRASIALEVAKTEPQVLILDDVLVNTDPTRQQRVLSLLEHLARTMQVIVLTCHRDRYAGAGTLVEIRRETASG